MRFLISAASPAKEPNIKKIKIVNNLMLKGIINYHVKK